MSTAVCTVPRVVIDSFRDPNGSDLCSLSVECIYFHFIAKFLAWQPYLNVLLYLIGSDNHNNGPIKTF